MDDFVFEIGLLVKVVEFAGTNRMVFRKLIYDVKHQDVEIKLGKHGAGSLASDRPVKKMNLNYFSYEISDVHGSVYGSDTLDQPHMREWAYSMTPEHQKCRSKDEIEAYITGKWPKKNALYSPY